MRSLIQPLRLCFKSHSPEFSLLSRTRTVSPHLSNRPIRLRVDQNVSSLTNKSHCRHMSSGERQDLLVPGNIIKSPFPDLEVPENLPFHEYIFSKCDKYKDAPAVSEFLTGKSCSYRELKARAIRVASALHKMGYRKGDIILVFSTNQIEYTILMLATSCLGVWFCAANPSFIADELSRQLTHSESIAVFTTPALTDTVNEALINKDFPHKIKDKFVFGESSGFIPFQSLLDDDGKSFPDVHIDPKNDVMVMPYSSGTTGLPKGVMLTHYNILVNVLQINTSLPLKDGENVLGLLPLYHIFGMVVIQYGCFTSGSQMHLLPMFEPETFLKCLQDRKISTFHAVPPLVLFLAKHPVVAKYDLSNIRKMVSGAAPLGPELTTELLQRFNHQFQLSQGYGLTESSPVTNIDLGEELGSIGELVCNTQAKVIDIDTKETLGPNQSGEYCIKGPQVMKGYFMNQKATNDTIDADGWLRTGDVGHFNECGKIYISDRLKELIKYKGFQVAPAELEAILLGHPDVQDVAVIGIPDEMAGEVPKAFVVKKANSIVSENEVAEYLNEKVSRTKQLRGGVEFIKEVPKNPSGKILRRLLRTQ